MCYSPTLISLLQCLESFVPGFFLLRHGHNCSFLSVVLQTCVFTKVIRKSGNEDKIIPPMLKAKNFVDLHFLCFTVVING